MISIYSKIKSTRIVYVLDYVFKDLLQIDYKLTSNIDELSGVIINYSENSIEPNNYHIYPVSLLNDGVNLNPEVSFKDDSFTLFPSSNDHHGFDIFSAVFFLISRMEEYDLDDRDDHNRFKSENSILVKYKIHQKPIIDLWCYDLLDNLNKKFKTDYSSKRKFKQFCTLDIDNAFAFKHKGVLRTIGALIRDVLTFKTKKLSQRIRLVLGESKDPYDTFQYIYNFSNKHNLNQLYFFLLGDYGKNDKNIHFDHPALKALILETSTFAEVGIHPSYNSLLRFDQIEKEIQRLKSILKNKITTSRFHFLRFQFPSSFQNLVSLGIKEDYSMGFTDRTGFRAGTCTPFYFYDLEKELKTDLRIIPFTYMDGVLKDREKLSISESIQHIKDLKSEVKSVNGQFTAIWHNESLSDQSSWLGWRSVFESTWI